MVDSVARWRVFLVVFAFLVLIIGDGGPAADACSMPAGWKPLTDIEEILKATNVLYGRVRDTYPDERESSAYTAYIEVYCIMKGARTEQFINMSEAGYIPGLCHRTNLTVGHNYVILAGHDDHGQYRPYGAFGVDDRQQLTRLATACGLQAVYPQGIEESTATVKCPTPAAPGECMSGGSRSNIPTLSIFVFFLVMIMLH